MYLNIFSIKLKKLRLDNNLTQSDLASILGTTKQAISLYESGKREPSLYIVIRICEHFNISMDSLILNRDVKKFSSSINSTIDLNKELMLEVERLHLLKNNVPELINAISKEIMNIPLKIDNQLLKIESLLLLQKNTRLDDRADNVNEFKIQPTGNNEVKELNPSDFISATLEKSTAEDKLKELSKQKQILNTEVGMIDMFIIGTVTCGVPTPPYTDIQEHMELPLIKPLSTEKDYFVLHASGDSMNKIISDGEQMIIEQTQIIEDGDIAVFLINGECTLKEYESDGDSSCTLKPLSTNPIHEDQYYESTVDLHVQGKYVCKVKDLLKEYDKIMNAKESL